MIGAPEAVAGETGTGAAVAAMGMQETTGAGVGQQARVPNLNMKN